MTGINDEHVKRIEDRLNKELTENAKKLLNNSDTNTINKKVVEDWTLNTLTHLTDNSKYNKCIDFVVDGSTIDIDGQINIIPKNLFTGLLTQGIYEPKAIGKREYVNYMGKYVYDKEKGFVFYPIKKEIVSIDLKLKGNE